MGGTCLRVDSPRFAVVEVNGASFTRKERMTQHTSGSVEIELVAMILRLPRNFQLCHVPILCFVEGETRVKLPRDEGGFDIALHIVPRQFVSGIRQTPSQLTVRPT